MEKQNIGGVPESDGDTPLGFRSKSSDSGTEPTNQEGENEKENTRPAEQLSSVSSVQHGSTTTQSATRSFERIRIPTKREEPKDPDKRRSRNLTQPRGTVVYIVAGNETLASIAAKFDTTTSEIKKLNKLMTQMIWPSQKLFVPDKDFVPSEHNTPEASPVQTPVEQKPLSFSDIPMVQQSEPKRHSSGDQRRTAPGLAKPVSPSSGGISPPALSTEPPRRFLSEQEAKELDEECHERFIKVGCKYITDGQGVVSGVLLVTPNAMMFDPNANDPLVVEHGGNKYGLIAPLETVISVAMYQDIAAMKKRTSPETVAEGKPEVYRLSQEVIPPDLLKDIPPATGSSELGVNTEDACSCGPDSSAEQVSSQSPARGDQGGDLPRDPGGETWPTQPTITNNRDQTPSAPDNANPLLLDNTAIESRKKPDVSSPSESEKTKTGSENFPTTSSTTTTSTTGSVIPKVEDNFGDNTGKGIYTISGSSGNTTVTIPGLNIEGVMVKSTAGGRAAGDTPQQTQVISAVERSGVPERSESGQLVSTDRAAEKSELFRSLDAMELIPKPATEYINPPLYLCLKVGQLKKRSSTTCPIQAYDKDKLKPEYWFSIPKDKVDPLYAFFLQWSPDLYGEAETDDIESRGFVAVSDVSQEEEEIEVIDDYFDKNHSVSKARRVSLTKGWEVISNSLSLGYIEEVPIPPELLSPSVIMNDDHTMKLSQALPPRAEGYSWKLLYTTLKDGFSLKTLYRFTSKVESPVLLVVQDTASQVFGAMLSCGPRMSDHFYGTGETYLFTFYEEFRIFRWTGVNNFYMKGNLESMSVGAGEGSFGLWLDSDLYHGRTQKCSTYNNELLTEREDFVIKAIEVWTFV